MLLFSLNIIVSNNNCKYDKKAFMVVIIQAGNLNQGHEEQMVAFLRYYKV